MAATCVAISASQLAIGLESGDVLLYRHGIDEPTRLPGHDGGVACVAFDPDGVHLVCSGVNGSLRVTQCARPSESMITYSPAPSSSSNAHKRTPIASIDMICCSRNFYAAPVGKSIAIGKFASPSISWIGETENIIDGVQIVDDSLVFGASFGGLKVWHAGENCKRYSDRLPAANRSATADLAVAGWARSLLASPSGAWLAAWVTVAGSESSASRLWLWRTSDGADFECGGFNGPLDALAWSADSRLLATCCGSEATVWFFGSSSAGPAGRTPTKLRASCGQDVPEVRLLSAAFSPDARNLACGTKDGAVVVFSLLPDAVAQAGEQATPRAWRPKRPALVQRPRTSCDGEDADAKLGPIEHVGWWESTPGLLVAAGSFGSVVTGLASTSDGHNGQHRAASDAQADDAPGGGCGATQKRPRSP